MFSEVNFRTMAVSALSSTTDLLFLGSSRVFYGIDPNRYGYRTVSLASDYLDAAHAERLWDLYQKTASGVKLVVIEGGLAALYYDTSRLAPTAVRDLGIEPLLPVPFSLTTPIEALRHQIWPIYRWRLTPEALITRNAAFSSREDPLQAAPGYVPSEAVLTYPEVFATREIEKARRQIAEVPLEAIKRNKEALKRLVEKITDRGTRVVILVFPMHIAARTQIPDEWRTLVDDAHASLPQSSLVSIWDMSDVSGLETEDFRDPDHLNARGARHFATILSPRLTQVMSNIPASPGDDKGSD